MSVFDGKEAWWGVVTGPREIVRDVLSFLSKGDSVLLATKGSLPWRDEFWLRITGGLSGFTAIDGMTIQEVCADDLGDDEEPCEYLLERFALRDDAISYRIGADPYQYLISRRVLSGMVVHVHGKDEGKLRQWAEFCAKWPKGSRDTGLFLLEMPDERCGFENGNLNRIDYAKRVSGYSIQLFCGLCLEHGISSELSEARRRYLTSAITHLCRDNVELSERMAARLNNPPFDPSAAYRELGGGLGADALQKCVWEAQIETVFAIVQRRHMTIVDMLRPQIQESLDRYFIRASNGERITDPDDTDPGTLVYLFTATDREGNRLLSVPDGKLRDEMYLLMECRNALAHRQCCSEEQIKALLD